MFVRKLVEKASKKVRQLITDFLFVLISLRYFSVWNFFVCIFCLVLMEIRMRSIKLWSILRRIYEHINVREWFHDRKNWVWFHVFVFGRVDYECGTNREALCISFLANNINIILDVNSVSSPFWIWNSWCLHIELKFKIFTSSCFFFKNCIIL